MKVIPTALFAGALAAAGMGATAAVAERGPASQMTAEQVLEMWKSDPKSGDTIRRMEKVFPADLLKIAQTALDQERQGVPDEELGATVASGSFRLMQGNLHFLANAPPEILIRFAAGEAESYTALKAKDVRLCAAAVVGGQHLSEADQGIIQSSEGLAFRAELDGIEAGRDHPTSYAAATTGDIDRLTTAMSELGASPAMIALFNSDALKSAGPDLQCDVGILMMRAMTKMPPESAARFLSVVARRLGGDPITGVEMQAAQTSKLTDRQILDALESNPEVGGVYSDLEAEFPSEAMSMAERVGRDLRAGSAPGMIRDTQEALKTMLHSNAAAIEQAPDDKILAFLGALETFYETMQSEDAETCGLVAMGEASMSPNMTPAMRRASLGNFVTLSKAVIAGRRALREAGVASVTTGRAPPRRPVVTSADQEMLIDAVAAGGASADVLSAFRHGDLSHLRPVQQCDATLRAIQAMQAVSPAVGARLGMRMAKRMLTSIASS